MDGLWEVLLPAKWIAEIRRVAKKRQVTLSWVVRYCTFKFMRRKKISLSEKEQTIVNIIREEMQNYGSRSKKNCSKEKLMHRLQVCFYGEDERWLRMVALELNLTVSMLIRIAIYRYLFTIEEEKSVPAWRLFWMGIKFIFAVNIKRHLQKGAVSDEIVSYILFRAKDFWKEPLGHLPTRLL